MKVMILGLIAFLSASSAFAVSVEFSFDINSSGPSIYPCNAGIRHDAHSSRVCYDRVTQSSCNPSACVSEQACNCVCTGSTNDQGEYRLDFMRASFADWTDNGQYAGSSASKNLYAKNGSFHELFDVNNKEEWNKQVTKLEFDLGSERYGAEFYLDVCYRGPQIEYFYAQQNGGFSGSPSGYEFPNFALKSQATVTDLVSSNGLRYSDLSDLKVKVSAVCDQQGKGSYPYAGSGNPAGATVYDQVLNDIIGVTVTGGQYAKTVPYRSFNNASSLYLIDEFINANNAFTPRFCKVRYTFIENRRNDSNLLSQIRKWKQHKAQVCTFTEINEPAI